jgi:AraC-like DNA-binding protein
LIVLWDIEHDQAAKNLPKNVDETEADGPIRHARDWDDAQDCVIRHGCGALLIMTSQPQLHGIDVSSLITQAPVYVITSADDQVKLLIKLFIFYLASQVKDTPDYAFAPGSPGDEIDWNKALSYIHENLDNSELSLEDVSKQNFVCKWHFSKMFKKKLGITFREFIIKERIDWAKRLLLANGSVTSVCYQVGYGDLTHFGRMFQRKVGMPPSQYRRLYGKPRG